MGRKYVPEQWQNEVNGWLESLKVANCTAKTIESRRYKISHLASLLGKCPYEVSESDLARLLSSVKWRPETLKSYRNTLNSFYTWLYKSGLRADNPTLDLPKTRRPKAHPHPCPENYIMSALSMATDSERVMLRLAAECGLRRAEIAQVSSNDLIEDLLGMSLIVHGKGDKERIVPLPDDLAELISLANGYVFPGRFSGHVEESYIGKHVSKLLPDGWACHSLRHRYATKTWESTHDLLLVSELLGHSSVETTQVYVAMPDERKRVALNAVKLFS